MEEYCVSNNYFGAQETLSTKGRESIIYINKNSFEKPMCIKRYASSFLMNFDNDQVIKKLFSLNEKLANTDLVAPSIIFYNIEEYKKGNKQLVGMGIPFLEGYVSIDNIINLNDKIECIKQLIILLKKLISLDIYPTDLNTSNILVSKELDVQLIDLDGEACKVDCEENKEYYYKEIYKSIQYRILVDLLLTEEEYNLAYKYESLNEGIRIILIEKGYNINEINMLLSTTTDYVDLDNLLMLLNDINMKETKDIKSL